MHATNAKPQSRVFLSAWLFALNGHGKAHRFPYRPWLTIRFWFVFFLLAGRVKQKERK